MWLGETLSAAVPCVQRVAWCSTSRERCHVVRGRSPHTAPIELGGGSEGPLHWGESRIGICRVGASDLEPATTAANALSERYPLTGLFCHVTIRARACSAQNSASRYAARIRCAESVW